jgi:hypothetical protein
MSVCVSLRETFIEFQSEKYEIHEELEVWITRFKEIERGLHNVQRSRVPTSIHNIIEHFQKGPTCRVKPAWGMYY